MKRLLTGVALAALVAIAMPGLAEAKAKAAHRMHHGWLSYSWYGPYAWGPAHAKSDFVANGLNRAVLSQITYNGALGLDRVALNPLPPRVR